MKKDKLTFFKENFSHSPKFLHLNNAGLAPISYLAHQKINYWSERFYREGFFTDHDYMNDVAQTREELALLIGSASSNIAFFQNTSGAISQLAFHYPLTPSDEVLIWDQDYGSNLYPWTEACRRRQAKLVIVPSAPDLTTPFESLIASVTSKTKVIAISWVQFQTGSITDLLQLGQYCEQKNIFLAVDIMQGLGWLPFNMTDFKVSAVTGGNHKWLFSPVGLGFLAIDQKYHHLFQIHNVGQNTYGTCDDPTSLVCSPKLDASKFESGCKQVLEITALGASLKLIRETGIDLIYKETLRLTEKLKMALQSKGFNLHETKQGITSSPHINVLNKEKIIELLTMKKANYAIRGPGVRLSPAAFLYDEEIERLFE
jgi:cysteine desulfurase / selenocysteine lyase